MKCVFGLCPITIAFHWTDCLAGGSFDARWYPPSQPPRPSSLQVHDVEFPLPAP